MLFWGDIVIFTYPKYLKIICVAAMESCVFRCVASATHFFVFMGENMMENIKCKTCGGSVNRVGNYYVCEWCRNKWEIDRGNDIHAVDRANAWSALRDGNFEKAVELFENIILKEDNNHEAYWGRALALSGIVYVTDMNENKKVPTCNNITEESFITNKDVQKAISLAPVDIADEYKQQASYIEKVRVEWLEKASKEPAYDVFISFKDSDRENGIERTQDSIDAQDLYNALIAEGYKVFFSRISLRDKISEQYEPYIYNAIKTAKVMIVFGERAEYFSSVWIKNEWSRFKTRIEKGEKHKNSLVVVYKNMNPGDLPVVLKSRQCLNASDMTFLSDLNRHIKRVVEESKRNVHLEKIEIAGGQIAKKATTLAVNSVQTREIGAGAIAETSITEKQSISLIYTYLAEQQWQEASSLVDDVLFNNPACAEALWCKILAIHQAENNEAIKDKINNFKSEDFGTIDKILNCASKDFAEIILTILYNSEEQTTADAYCSLLNIILPFSFSNRSVEIESAFGGTIERSKYIPFKLLLETLNSTDVDKYIFYNHKFATKSDNTTEQEECLKNILNVDEGNLDAIRLLTIVNLKAFESEKAVCNFENLLKYTTDISCEIVRILDWLCENISNPNQCIFAKRLLQYYQGDISELEDKLLDLCYKMLNSGLFAEVEYFLNIILSFAPNRPEIYWALCLMKSKAKTEFELSNYSEILISEIPEFNKYLSLVDDKKRQEGLQILAKQKLSTYRRKCEKLRGCISLFFEDEYHGRGYAFTLNLKTKEATIHYHNSLGNRLKYEKLQSILRVERSIVTFADGAIDFDNFKDGENRPMGIFLERSKDFMEKIASIQKISSGKYVVLYKDGSVQTKGNFSEKDESLLAVNTWKDIVQLPLVNSIEIIGLKRDGTLAIASSSEKISKVRREFHESLASLKDVVMIAFQGVRTAVLFDDGSVKYSFRPGSYDMRDLKWKNIVQLSFLGEEPVGVNQDGTISADVQYIRNRFKEWNIAAIVSAKEKPFSLILTKDGKVSQERGYHKDYRLNEPELKGDVRIFDDFESLKPEDFLISQKQINNTSGNNAPNAQSDTASPQRNTTVNQSKQGCYIATCVYGSYDCPEVWTLRRFRDETLRSSWYGRFFIRTYYAISPTLVKLFGKTTWFKKIWKGTLDKAVTKLQNRGIESTAYNDCI